jgi:ADP-ribose pyrophosphatase YjhB (NUDIX family)
MTQRYEVFFNNRLAVFTNEAGEGRDASLFFEFTSRRELLKLVRMFEKTESIQTMTIYSRDFKQLKKALKSCFRVIKAAGGLVRNGQGDVLMIFRRGVWDLPKGKLEHFENYLLAGLREVKEECGLQQLEHPQWLTATYHVYRLNNKPVLKKTVWFSMLNNGSEMLKPQVQEEIAEVRWVPVSEIPGLVQTTYGNIRLVLQAAKLL